MIAGALAFHVISSLVVVYVATSDPSYAVEDDYYQKAVAWDEKRAQDRTERRSGWCSNSRSRLRKNPATSQPSI